MKTVTIQDIKRHGSKALHGQGPVYLIVNSQMNSVILPLKEFESLVDALEEYEDILAIRERKDDALVPWDEVFPAGK